MMKGFLIYTDYEKYFDMLPATEQVKLIKALFAAFNGTDTSEIEKDMDGATKMAFAFMGSQLQADAQKYEEKCVKNRANASKPRESGTRSKQNKQENASECTKEEANVDESERTLTNASECKQKAANASECERTGVNINKNKNNKYKCIIKNNTNIYNVEQSIDDAHFLIDYLNSKAGTHFKLVQSNLKFLLARLKEYSKEDVQKVIDKKVAEWKGTSMQKYLRPETLFNATKFEGYLHGLEEPTAKEQAPAKLTQKTGIAIRHREYTKEELSGVFSNLEDFIGK